MYLCRAATKKNFQFINLQIIFLINWNEKCVKNILFCPSKSISLRNGLNDKSIITIVSNKFSVNRLIDRIVSALYLCV